MGLSLDAALKAELRQIGTQKHGRYPKRSTFYCYACLKCGAEIWFQRSDLKRMSGRCRKCADADTAKLSLVRNRKRPYEALYNKFMYDRNRAGQETDLSYQDFIEFTKNKCCHYCSAPIEWAEYCLARNGYNYNLDRMDNARSYFRDNLVSCCWPCNEMKGARLTYEEMKAAMRAIIEVRNGANEDGTREDTTVQPDSQGL